MASRASSRRTREGFLLRWLIALLAASLSGAVQAADGPSAREGTRLFEALESARLVVVGEVRETTELDRHGRQALLVVESTLVGEVTGETLPVVWEELSAQRAPRFAKGDRILLVLESLTGGSLWRERIPDPAAYLRARRVAQRGLAFVRSPSLGSLLQLQHYLALGPADRTGPVGQGRLLALAAEAEPALAVSAAAQLAARADPGGFDGAQAPLALAALARADTEPALESPLLAWVERVQPAGVAAALDGALAGDASVPASWVAARARLPGGLAAESIQRLLEEGSPARRRAAAQAAGLDQRDELASLARSDPAPAVRSAALARLTTLTGVAALDTILAAFADRDAALRGEAAGLAAGLGSPAVSRLREVALRWPDPAPETAVLALRLCEARQASQVLSELADEHPEARIRALAALAIGRPLGHAD